MSSILLLSGISNSGKSTFAKTVVDAHPSEYIIVQRDKLREMAYGCTESNVWEYYSRKDFALLESQITAMQDSLISFWLKRGKTVIIDNTNLKKKYIKKFDKFKVSVEVKYFDINLEEALTRNMSRNRKVDENVIIKQYNSYIQLRSNSY
jgi:predicted kinase